jgi:hypothetical protein
MVRTVKALFSVGIACALLCALPSGAASFTLAVMTSPIPALCAPPLPITPIIVAMRAPLLSATSNLDLR